MATKTGISVKDRQEAAKGLIEQIKAKNSDWTAADRAKIFATCYSLALKEKKEDA